VVTIATPLCLSNTINTTKAHDAPTLELGIPLQRAQRFENEASLDVNSRAHVEFSLTRFRRHCYAYLFLYKVNILDCHSRPLRSHHELRNTFRIDTRYYTTAMDTSYLTSQVATIIGQLHGLFDEIGVPHHERESRESEVGRLTNVSTAKLTSNIAVFCTVGNLTQPSTTCD